MEQGTVALRSHVDIDPEINLANLEVILALCEQMRERVSIQLVAFPQIGVRAAPGTAALLEEALKLRVETIGGLDPAAFDSDVEGQLDLVFDLAVRYLAGIDIHLHDGGELGIFELGKIAERCRTHGPCRAGRGKPRLCVGHGSGIRRRRYGVSTGAGGSRHHDVGVQLRRHAAGEIAVGLRRGGLGRLRQHPPTPGPPSAMATCLSAPC